MKKFTSIKEIPKAAIEMIDDAKWWCRLAGVNRIVSLPERLDSDFILEICNNIEISGEINKILTHKLFYKQPKGLEDKSWGKILYEKIHGLA
jgi:hypothetical protein